MIDLGSLAGLHEHQHELAAFCAHCDRWAVLPLAKLIARGQGARRLPITVRCVMCGQIGTLQVRPPVSTRGDAVGWISPADGKAAGHGHDRASPTHES